MVVNIMDRGIIIVNSAGEEFREIIGTSDSNSDKHVTHLRNYLKELRVIIKK